MTAVLLTEGEEEPFLPYLSTPGSRLSVYPFGEEERKKRKSGGDGEHVQAIMHNMYERTQTL